MPVNPLAPVVSLDIDGVLADYHKHFTRFARMWTGNEMMEASWVGAHGDFARALGMSKTAYRKCKLSFRLGNMKRSIPAFSGARDLTVGIRKLGLQVWICTTRPYLKLEDVDTDTRFWLRHNGIQHDGVLYGDKKYKDLVRLVGKDRVVCVVDDLPEMVLHAKGLGLSSILVRGPHNAYWKDPLQMYAWNLRQVGDLVRQLLREGAQ
jgi:hypothetical protein